MAKTIYVECPFCEGMMEVDVSSSKVIQKWTAQEKNASGSDKLSSALKKLGDDKKKRVDLFEQKKDELDKSKGKMDDLFKKEVKRVKKEGVKENPFKPFDLD